MNKKNNILYMIDNFCGIGGTERHLYYLSMHLSRDKFKPSVVVFDLKDNPLIADMKKAGIPVYHIPVGREYTWNALQKALQLSKIIKKEHIDIVQTYHLKSDTYGALIAHFSGIKNIVSSKRDTGDLKKGFHFAVHQLCNRYINNFIFVADSVRKEVCQKEKICNKNTKVIYNGINADKFSPPDIKTKREARDKLGLGAQDFVAGIVAWLRPEKGHAALFEAIKIARGKIPNLKLVAVGGGYLHDQYQELIKQEGLSENILITGATSDVLPYLEAFDLACLVPCANEGFSNSILEKMSIGLPMIVTDMGGNAEAVVDGYNGFVIPPNDSKSMARCLITLFEDKEKRLEMGRRSRQLVQEKFTLENMIKQHETFYESIITNSKT